MFLTYVRTAKGVGCCFHNGTVNAEIESLDEDMELVQKWSKSASSLSKEPFSSKRSRHSVMKTKNINEKMLEIAKRNLE